jgi:hypothetical protein
LSLDDLAPRVNDLKAPKDNLQARKWGLEWRVQERKPELADTATVTHCVQDLPNVLSDNSLAVRKSFIKSFVKEVRGTGDKALLTCMIPLPPRGLIVEEIPVLSAIQLGGPLLARTTDPGLIRTEVNLLILQPTYLINPPASPPFLHLFPSFKFFL